MCTTDISAPHGSVREAGVTTRARTKRAKGQSNMAAPIQMSEQQLQALASVQASMKAMLQMQTQEGAAAIDRPRGSFATCTSRFDGKPTSDVATFINAITIYKECANISDESALRGLPMLLEGIAATWWQGVKATVEDWPEAIENLRHTYGIRKPNFRIYRDIFAREQSANETTDVFVCEKRALLSQLTTKLAEEVELDMVYGLLNHKIRERVPRGKIATFKELLDEARTAEETLREISGGKSQTASQSEQPRCKICRNRGHVETECRRRLRRVEDTAPKPSTSSENRPKTTSSLACYGCGRQGYIRSNCPDCRSRGRQQTETSSADMDLDFHCVSTKPKLNTAPQPHVLIKVNGLCGSACLDTGARQSIAGYDLFRQLCARGVIFARESVRVTLADGRPQDCIVRLAEVPVTLCGRYIPTVLVAFEDEPQSRTLLGCDFTEGARMILNLGRGYWSFEDAHERYDFWPEPGRSNDVPVTTVDLELRPDEGVSLSLVSKDGGSMTCWSRG